jgi:3-isopropylmalate dehydrogenase
MAKYKIAWLPGDGIGKDVMEAAKIVLEAIELDANYIPGDVGWEFWKKEGNALPDRTLKLLRETDCCLFGAITSKPKDEAEKELNPDFKEKGYIYLSPILRIRQELNLHTNFRPCKAYKGNPLNYRDDIDLAIFRENTEGLYSGIEFYPLPEELRDSLLKNNPRMKKFENTPLDEVALSCRFITKEASQSIVRQGFEYAKKYNKKSVTLVEKPNVLRETSGLIVREARKIAKDYPGIELWETNIDAMGMWLVKNPEKYSVLVATNLFGDIISDLAAQLVGGLGFTSSANIGDNYALFEPTHGSAPKYAGLYKVNPTAMLSAVALMLDYLKEDKLAYKLKDAIARVIEEGKVRTYDLGGTASTLDVAREVAKKMQSD